MGSGGLHHLNAQGGSQGLPPWWPLGATRGAREGMGSLGVGLILFEDKKGFGRGPPPFRTPFYRPPKQDRMLVFFKICVLLSVHCYILLDANDDMKSQEPVGNHMKPYEIT